MNLHMNKQWTVYAISLAVAGAIIAVGAFLFLQARSMMQEQIRERLSSTAAAAALYVNGDLLDAIRLPKDTEKEEYAMLIERLNDLRQLPDIRFAYILRRTEDPMVLAFVADADTALTDAQLDVNGNGVVDPDEEPAYPGELYDVTEVVALQEDAFNGPTADHEITQDQWGNLVSGYAPIRRSDGSVAAVLGIDMRADDFQRLSNSVFSPLALLLLFAGVMMIAVYVGFDWERRRAGVLERINDERSGLLRLTFHQLGEPLTIMKWSLETLREETESPELKKIVDEHVLCMDEGLGRLNSIIDTLQLAEKVDLDTLEYVAVPTSLRSLLENSAGEWQSSLLKRNQTLKIDMKGDLTISLDKSLLTLVLRQLLVNAIEYADDGTEIGVRVLARRHDVLVSVQDKGFGIPKKDLPHLFEKYRRASNAHLKKPDGNGLGLYIAKGIIEKAGGRIWIESEEKHGTSVFFTLPKQA